MKERPILFSGPMVKAILEGRKAQTRRAINLNIAGRVQLGRKQWHPEDANATQGCPYGVRGDRLWVRETFAEEIGFYGSEPPYNDGRPILRHNPENAEDERPAWTQCHYRATDPVPDLVCHHERCVGGPCRNPWRPSIFMPRWASRITLEIAEVRVQRLQEISGEDAIAEGCGFDFEDGNGPKIPRINFSVLWDSINAARGYGWESNPWVWAISFSPV